VHTARLLRFFDQTCDPVRVRTAYKCRVYPDRAQQAVLNRTFGCVRVVWNRTLAARQARWHLERKGTSYAESDRALTAIKKDPGLAFLKEVSSVPLQQTLRHQHQAFGAFFAGRARYPRFKSRRSRQSAHYTRSAFTMCDGELRLAKMSAALRYVWSWSDKDLTSLDPAMVIVSREPDGRWYVTFTVDATAPVPLEETGRAIGIDLGVTDFAAISDGDKIANPRHLERKARRLARYQRRMARRQEGSANRAKAAAKVARAHRKVRNARRDFLHRVGTRLVRTADLIAIEDLPVRNMIRNRHLARVISDCGWGEFRRQLAYKCQRYGRRLVVIDRWYPSSKTCAACGHLLADLSPSTRHWTCPSCGTRHDRDVNAAKNILAAGLAVARGSPGDACGADVRHSGSSRVRPAAKQEPQFLDGRDPARYAWLATDEIEYEVTAAVADAAHRLSGLRLAAGDADGAMEAARAGLRLAFNDEILWRDLLTGAHATGQVLQVVNGPPPADCGANPVPGAQLNPVNWARNVNVREIQAANGGG
jgi:putative transposase